MTTAEWNVTDAQAMSLELGTQRPWDGASADIEVFVGVGGDLDDVADDDDTAGGSYADDTKSTRTAASASMRRLEELTLVTLKNNNDTPSSIDGRHQLHGSSSWMVWKRSLWA